MPSRMSTSGLDIDSKLTRSLDQIIASNKAASRSERKRSEPKQQQRRKRQRERDPGMQQELPQHTNTITVARRVFVGNLDWKTTWQELKEHFRPMGSVVFAEVLVEPGGRSKGCGIVEFSQPEEAARAIEEMQQSTLHGRQIFVREDREDKELLAALGRKPGAGAGVPMGMSPARGPRVPSGEPSAKKTRPSHAHNGTYGSGYHSNGHAAGQGSEEAVVVGRKLFVSALHKETTWQALKDHFRNAGAVAHAVVLMHEDGSSRCCGIVEMTNAVDALRAISQLSNSVLDGTQIHVREYREDRAGPGGAPPAPGPRVSTGPTPQGEVQVVVQGLPYKMVWQGFKDLVRDRTRVEALRAHISTKADGTSKGWGLLLFRNMQEAQACIKALNGCRHDGRVLTAKLDSKQ